MASENEFDDFDIGPQSDEFVDENNDLHDLHDLIDDDEVDGDEEDYEDDSRYYSGSGEMIGDESYEEYLNSGGNWDWDG